MWGLRIYCSIPSITNALRGGHVVDAFSSVGWDATQFVLWLPDVTSLLIMVDNKHATHVSTTKW